jgi:hypothetical protein
MVGEHHKARKFRFAPLRWYYQNKFFFMLICCVSVEVRQLLEHFSDMEDGNHVPL